jgi:hypothetical protein
MGVCTDIMYDFVLQEINRIYSSYDGWKITPFRHGNSYDTTVRLERRNIGSREIVKIFVSFKKEVTLNMLEDLIKPEKTGDGLLSRQSYAVMVPSNADTSALPSDLKIYTMKSFAFQGKELTWVKKPVRKNDETVSKSAP